MGKVRSNPPQRGTGYKSKLGVTGSKGVHKKNSSSADNKKKFKAASLKNQIRSTQRFLQRDLSAELREAQEKKLEELKKQQLDQNRLAEERKNFIRDKKIKFFERRKIERRMRRMEKQQRGASNEAEEKKISEEIQALKQDLEYVRFFPKAEKYVPLFCGDDNPELVDKRTRLRLQIKENIIAAAASGKDLEETGSEDNGPTDLTDDDFFVSGSTSDEADADDELTDLSAREQPSSAVTKVPLGLPNDKTNQRGKPSQSSMPPPRSQKSSIQRFDMSTSWNTSKGIKSHSKGGGFQLSQGGQSRKRISGSYITKPTNFNTGFPPSQASQSSNRISKSNIPKPSYDKRFQHGQAGPSGNRSSHSDTPVHANEVGYPNSHVSQSSNISSNSDARKKKRKRRPKKRKQ